MKREVYLPTEEEIAQGRLEVQKGWSKLDFIHRRYGKLADVPEFDPFRFNRPVRVGRLEDAE